MDAIFDILVIIYSILLFIIFGGIYIAALNDGDETMIGITSVLFWGFLLLLGKAFLL